MHDEHDPHPTGVQAHAGGDVTGCRANAGEQHADRQERGECVCDRERIGKRVQRPPHHCKAAAEYDLLRRNVVTRDKVSRCVDDSRQHDCEGRA